jgi:hypothetical protein
MDEGLIQVQAMATRIACLRMTAQHLTALRDTVERASCLPARSDWDRKAAAHAEIFHLLADAATWPRKSLPACWEARPAPPGGSRGVRGGARRGPAGAAGDGAGDRAGAPPAAAGRRVDGPLPLPGAAGPLSGRGPGAAAHPGAPGVGPRAAGLAARRPRYRAEDSGRPAASGGRSTRSPATARRSGATTTARAGMRQQDPDPLVRRDVIHALTDSTPAPRVPAVIQALKSRHNDPDERTRRRVRKTLAHYRRTGRVTDAAR